MRIITIDLNNTIIGVKEVNGDYVLESNEIETELGELGQIQQADGTFITPTPVVEPQPYEPTNSEIAQMISDLQADLIISGVIV